MKPPSLRKKARLQIRPIELKDANAFVERLHRHHKPVVGHRFSLCVVDETGAIRGVAIVGRPVARRVNYKEVLEVTRLCTDGCPNACSALYAAAARVGKELGYRKIQTYVLATEPGVSLKAAGWIDEGEAGGGDWNGTGDRQGTRRTDQPMGKKRRWARILRAPDPPGLIA